ncbi:hypothetical protein ABZP36_020347 [Zizania latifolia]
MSTATPRGRSSQRRARCKCAGGGDRAAPCCFNPLRCLFRCPGRGRGQRDRGRGRSTPRTPSRVRDAPVDGAEHESEEPSFFVYAMPNQGGGPAEHSKKKKKKHGKPRLPSIRSCFLKKKNKERNDNAAVSIRRQALTPAPSLVTHWPRSPSPEKTQAVAPSVTQPPSPAVTENCSTNSPAPPNRIPATPRPGKQSTSSSASPFPPQWQQPEQVEGLEIVEVATDERLSAHDVGLIEMVGSSTDVSAESSVKSSLEYGNNEPPPRTSKRAVMVQREAAAVKSTEPARLWLNGNAETDKASERFTGPPVAGEADELWAHDIASSRVHAVMLAETTLTAPPRRRATAVGAANAGATLMAATSQSLLSPAPIRLSGARLDFPARGAVALRRFRRPAFPAVAAASTSMASSESEEKKENKLWGGRFEEGVTDAVERFTESISYDWQLYKYDIMGSKAHASMLAAQGLITAGDKDIILEGLDQIEKLIQDGKFEWRKDREDVHMNIEAALIEKVGEPAKKLHTARSRNDQIVTDLRLWCRDAIDKILTRIKQFQVSLVLLASKYIDLIVPGYTHLQRAQPVLLPHLLLSYVEQLERDAGRLVNCRERLNFCPLGACALAGTGLPIDRFKTAKDLKFTAPMKNSIDAVSDRDFVLEFLAANSIAAVHLSRIGEEWVLWASEEFGFLTPSDSVSTGSSIMPQKKNPDPMELVRGKSARVVGDLMTVLTLCKGLPQAYNRDLQEDKEPLFDSVKAVLGMLEVCTEFAQNISFNSKRIQSSLPAGYLDATTLADYLVKKGVPFRTSHEIVGRSVALCVSKNCQLAELGIDDLKAVHPVFEADVYEYLGVENAVNKFISYGSTGSEQVKKQLEDWRAQLGISS